MKTLPQAIEANEARTAYQASLALACTAWAAARGMQWRTAARLFDQAAAALQPDPHGAIHADANLYSVRAHICRTMIPCAVPRRALPDAVDYHRRLREGSAS